jgi:hypothetical protein
MTLGELGVAAAEVSALIFVLGVALIYASVRVPARATFVEIPAAKLGPKTTRLRAELVELVELGYDEICRLRQTDVQIPVAVIVFHHALHGHAAMIASVGQREYVEMASEFPDGTEVDTNNSAIVLGMWVPRPKCFVYQLPWVEGVAELDRTHRLLCQKHAPGLHPVLPPRTGVIDDLATSMAKTPDHQVRLGLMRLADGHYRPTLRGAIRCTAWMTPPVPFFRRIVRSMKVRRVLRELEGIRSPF